MPKVFSSQTLEKFEAASASIPLRQLDRAFASADIRAGKDPGGPEGARRVQFRRYMASIDQHDPQQLDRLGDVLGTLIEEVAASKQDFLIKAAERDGFFLADGVLRAAKSDLRAFTITRIEDFEAIEDRGRQLHLLASDSPKDAIDAAMALFESICRTVLRLLGKANPGKTANLSNIATATLKAFEALPAVTKNDTILLRGSLQLLCDLVTDLSEMQNTSGSRSRPSGKRGSLTPRYARLLVGAVVALAGFIAETYTESRSDK